MKKVSFILLFLLFGAVASCSNDSQQEKKHIQEMGEKSRKKVNEAVKRLYLKIERGIFLIVYPQLDRKKPNLGSLYVVLAGFLNYHGDGLRAINVEVDKGKGFRPFITVWIGGGKKNYHNRGITAKVSKELKDLKKVSQKTDVSGSGVSWTSRITLFYRDSSIQSRLKEVERHTLLRLE